MKNKNLNKRVLLVVGDYNREDFVSLFKNVVSEVSIHFIYFDSEKEVKQTFFKTYGENIFWKDYSNAYQLLNKIKPFKVVFFFIESYNQVALNVACKAQGIPTFHIEHGYRNFKVANLIYELKKNTKTVKSVTQITFKERFQSQLFYFRTLLKSDFKKASFLIRYYITRRNNSSLETNKLIKDKLRVADAYISFSPAIFEQHKYFDHLEDNQKAYFIGIPYFDDLFHNYNSNIKEIKNLVLFVDHPHVTKQNLGWTFENKVEFIKNISISCRNNGFKLLVKTHPYAKEDVECWLKVMNEGFNIKIIDNNFLQEEISEIPVILGFFSTLLIPLAALKHTVLFTFECHPAIEDESIVLSDFLVNSGVSEPIYEPDSLNIVLKNLNYYREKQKRNKHKFIDKWLYKFDGQSNMRLKNILLDEVD